MKKGPISGAVSANERSYEHEGIVGITGFHFEVVPIKAGRKLTRHSKEGHSI